MTILPARDQILQLQQTYNAYYFSGAWDAVLRKHGWLAMLAGDRKIDLFVGRHAAPAQLPDDEPAVIEGPLCQQTLDKLGLSAAAREAHVLKLTGPDLASHAFSYSTFTVRRVPAPRRPTEEPKPFVSDDPKWTPARVHYQTLAAPEGWRVVLEAQNVDAHGGAEPVAVTDGRRLVLGVPVFDQIVYEHTFPPLGDAGYYAMTRYAAPIALERWILQQARQLLGEHATIVSVDPWPNGRTAAFTVRHDYDRDITPEALRRHLRFYERHGIKATWFWKVEHPSPTKIQMVRDAGHEVALHTEAATFDGFKAELDALSHAMGGAAVRGMSAHGSAPSLGYVGAEQHQWCIDAGLLYGEMLGKRHMPHAAILIREGTPHITPLVLPGLHDSLDLSKRQGEHRLTDLLNSLPARIENGEHVVVMNHPDIHEEALHELCAALPLERVWKATLADVSEWTARVKQPPCINSNVDGISIRFEKPVAHDSVLRFMRGPDHRVVRAPKGVDRVNVSTDGVGAVTAPRPLENYFDEIRTVLEEEAGDDVESWRATIETNTTALPMRAQRIIDESEITAGDAVAELGCGYGFVSLAVALLTGARVTGYDLAAHYLAAGQRLLERCPELQPQYRLAQLDYTTESLPRAEFDVAVLNNTFCYVVGRRLQQQTIQRIFDTLRPGGRIYLYHPNQWHPREPFTKMWFVHWLPRRLGNWFTTRRGKRSLLDMHFQSPWWMRRLLRRAGFRDVRYHGGLREQGLRRWLASYYSMTARKPD